MLRSSWNARVMIIRDVWRQSMRYTKRKWPKNYRRTAVCFQMQPCLCCKRVFGMMIVCRCLIDRNHKSIVQLTPPTGCKLNTFKLISNWLNLLHIDFFQSCLKMLNTRNLSRCCNLEIFEKNASLWSVACRQHISAALLARVTQWCWLRALLKCPAWWWFLIQSQL